VSLVNTPVAGTEQPRAGDFISSEAQGWRSRDQVTLLGLNDSSTHYVAGTVLGQATIGLSAVYSGSPDTCGTITLSAGVKEGVYRGTYVTAGATAKAILEGPDGVEIGTVTVGTAFSGGGLAFTLTDAGGHAAIGDVFTITVGSATFANGGSDTGNGTCSAITVDPTAISGAYTFTATDATHFTGVDPNGKALSNLTVGSAYADGGLHFTITAGGTAYVAGDTFTVTVAAGSGIYTAVSATAADGTQYAAGILVFPQDVSTSTNPKVAIVARAAEVKSDLLAWPSGATADQILTWKAQLKALGIISRGDLV